MRLRPLLPLILSSSLICLAPTNAMAVAKGFFAQAQVGYGMTHYSAGDLGLTSASVDNDNVAGRVGIGYQFDKYFGVGMGYTKFSDTEFTKINGPAGPSGNIEQSAVDLHFDEGVPIGSHFGIYIKGGIADVFKEINNGVKTLGTKSSTSAIRPEYGAGLRFSFTPNVTMDASWTRIMEGNGIENADFADLGLTYYFA